MALDPLDLYRNPHLASVAVQPAEESSQAAAENRWNERFQTLIETLDHDRVCFPRLLTEASIIIRDSTL